MDWWRPIISGLVGALVVSLLFRLARPRARGEGDRKILEYGLGFKLLAVLFVPVSAFVAYAAAHARPSQAVAATLVALFFVLASGYLLYEVFFVKLMYDQRFIYHSTPLRGRRTVPWESVTEVGDSSLRQAHYLATRAHGTIWLSPWLNGVGRVRRVCRATIGDGMSRALLITLVLMLAAAPVAAQAPRDPLLERAKSLELNTPYVPPPGDPLEHHASGYAKVMCSAVFVTGLDPDFAAENVGFFTGPYRERARLGKPVIDRTAKRVQVTLPNGTTRTAQYLGDQGCVTLPAGKDAVYFKPVRVKSQLPPPSTQPWPTGDALPNEPLPAQLDAAKIKEAIDAAFEPATGMTAAFVVTWKGRLIGERYGEGTTMHTPLESWSMGKSVIAALMGVLIKQGVYALSQPAPIPEWQGPGDPRAKIRIADLLQMSSGLRIRAPQDPDYDPSLGYPDHVYLYTGGVNMFHYAATRPLQWPPGTVGRYRNSDPVLVSYLVRLGVERRGEEYLSFPQRALFDAIGIRTMVMETDPYGNFLTQGYELASARDWARLGHLYLQDGVWNGRRLLPEGYVKFVSTVAPAWQADQRPIYGGFFWINSEGGFPVPSDAYYMAGSGTQITMIIPSHDLVVVRMGHYRGGGVGYQSLARALALLMQAVPKKN